jgi:hypothetical protein
VCQFLLWWLLTSYSNGFHGAQRVHHSLGVENLLLWLQGVRQQLWLSSLHFYGVFHHSTFNFWYALLPYQVLLMVSVIAAWAECVFFRITQYNADAHNTHAHSPLWIHVRKPYAYEHLRRTEHRQIWRFPKSPIGASSSTGTSLTT